MEFQKIIPGCLERPPDIVEIAIARHMQTVDTVILLAGVLLICIAEDSVPGALVFGTTHLVARFAVACVPDSPSDDISLAGVASSVDVSVEIDVLRNPSLHELDRFHTFWPKGFRSWQFPFLIILGDASTMTRHPFYKKLFEYIEAL